MAGVKKKREELGIRHMPYGKYQSYLYSPDWKIISTCAKKLTNWKCEFCGKPAKAVHHIHYPKNRKDLGLETIACLCVVCHKCHEVLHSNNFESSETCILCGTKLGDHHSKRYLLTSWRQRICNRCNHLRAGYRDKAYGWTMAEYTEWIAEWQQQVFDSLILRELNDIKDKRRQY